MQIQFPLYFDSRVYMLTLTLTFNGTKQVAVFNVLKDTSSL